MIQNLISAILLVVLGTPMLLIIMFLPALLELRKPKDAGPRIIMEDFHERLPLSLGVAAIGNIEKEQRFDHSLLPQLMKAIEHLPSLEV
jgi:hypothetical protein